MQTAKEELANMKSSISEVDALRSDLAVYYCEDETTSSWTMLSKYGIRSARSFGEQSR